MQPPPQQGPPPPALPVQLELVVKRVAESGFAQLRALARSGKVQDSATRRRDLSDWARLMMNTFLRLLALVRWMRQQHRMTDMLTLSDFLHRCDAAVCNVPNSLGDFQVNGLDRVRVPRMDLPSAVAVLSTGSLALPRSLEASPVDVAAAGGAGLLLTDELDDLLRTRLSSPDDAAALQSVLMQETTMLQRGSLEFRGGVAELTVPGQFSVGLTVRSTEGAWILCWANILVREDAAPADASGSGDALAAAAAAAAGGRDPDSDLPQAGALVQAQAKWIVSFLRAHLQRGASLREVLAMLQQFCLKLQLSMLRTQASNLQRGRFSDVITVSDTHTAGHGAQGGGSDFTVSYWAAPPRQHACKIRISLPSRSKALSIHHSPPLVHRTDVPAGGTATAGTAGLTERISSDHVSFEKLLRATMQMRAANRVQRVASALDAGIDESIKTHLRVQVADKTDSAGYLYVDVLLPSARLELHVRCENGLLQLHQADGWRHDDVFAAWQEKLDRGSGVAETMMGAMAGTLVATHKRLVLESIVARAHALGARAETPQFQGKGRPAAAVAAAANEAEAHSRPADPFNANEGTAFLRIAADALDSEEPGVQQQQQQEQYFLAVSVRDNQPGDSFEAVLGAFISPSPSGYYGSASGGGGAGGGADMQGLALSTIIEIDSEEAEGSTGIVGVVDAAGDESCMDDTDTYADRQRRKRRALSAYVERALGPQSGIHDSSSGWSRPISIAKRSADVFESVDALIKQATSAVMAHRLRRALKAAGLQHVWVGPGVARVAVPPSAGAFSANPVVLRVQPNMHWQCQMDLPASAEHLKINSNSYTLQTQVRGVACDGSKVYFRYGAACNMGYLCSDITRVAHMAELCYSLAASVETDQRQNSIRVRTATLMQVVIECSDKAKTIIIVDARLSSTQSTAAATVAAAAVCADDSGSSSSSSSPRLCVTIDPRPDRRRLHFCTSFFPSDMYRIVGCDPSSATGGNGGNGGVPYGAVDVADLHACSRYLIEEDKQ